MPSAPPSRTRPALWSALALFLALLSMLSLPALAQDKPLRVLVMGDSLMAVNRVLGGSVAQALSRSPGIETEDRSVIGARYFQLPILGAAGLSIPAQVKPGPWDYVVMNGGGNDLLLGCGCGKCTRMLNRLISDDGLSGAIPDLVASLRATGARVIYTGYTRTPGLISPVEACGPLGDEMDRRLALMAERDEGITFLPLSNLVTKDGDRSFHGIDLVHPSVKGSRAIAERLAALIRP